MSGCFPDGGFVEVLCGAAEGGRRVAYGVQGVRFGADASCRVQGGLCLPVGFLCCPGFNDYAVGAAAGCIVDLGGSGLAWWLGMCSVMETSWDGGCEL